MSVFLSLRIMGGVLCRKSPRMTIINPMPANLIADLKNLLSPDRVISDPSELYVYDCDGFTIARSTPGAVVFPTTTEEVVRVVKLLAERDVQIVPRGSGT